MSDLSDWLLSISGQYPTSEIFDVNKLPGLDARRFASLWLIEGVPYAFRDVPAYFIAAREHLAEELGVTFRDISVTGSGRIGYSLSPGAFGREFNADHSDIDLLLVSDRWFRRVQDQAIRFINDYESKLITPTNNIDKRNWDSNTRQLRVGVDSGFVDPFKIPNTDRYPVVRKFLLYGDNFKHNVNTWSKSNIVLTSKIRVYDSWKSVVDQIGFNLKSAVKYKNPK